MLNQDESQYERQAGSERQNSQASAATPVLDQQVRQTIEALKLKVENLRLFLSWRR